VGKASVVPIEAIQPDLSEFGRYLYRLMVSKGIKTFNALASEMDTSEYRVFRQTVVKFAKGEQIVQPRFARRLATVLELSKQEERELAWMLYRYG
jgi:hypothetical protein